MAYPKLMLILVIRTCAFQTVNLQRRRPLRNTVRQVGEATEAITSALTLFGNAATPVDALTAMQQIYDSLPHADIDFDDFQVDPALTKEFKIDAFKQLIKRSNDDGIWTPETIESFKVLRSELDPLRTTELQGYLRFAGLVGGIYYIAALAVQWFLPEIFPSVYIFLALLFFAPLAYTFFLS